MYAGPSNHSSRGERYSPGEMYAGPSTHSSRGESHSHYGSRGLPSLPSSSTVSRVVGNLRSGGSGTSRRVAPPTVLEAAAAVLADHLQQQDRHGLRRGMAASLATPRRPRSAMGVATQPQAMAMPAALEGVEAEPMARGGVH